MKCSHLVIYCPGAIGGPIAVTCREADVVFRRSLDVPERARFFEFRLVAYNTEVKGRNSKQRRQHRSPTVGERPTVTTVGKRKLTPCAGEVSLPRYSDTALSAVEELVEDSSYYNTTMSRRA